MAEPNTETDRICRACMAQLGAEQFDLLETEKFTQLFIRLSSSQFDAMDFLPKSICAACYNLIVDFERFQTMCVESYKLLLVKFTQINFPKVENDEVVKIEKADSLEKEDPLGKDDPIGKESPFEKTDLFETFESDVDDDENDVSYDPLNDDDGDDDDEDGSEANLPDSDVVMKAEVSDEEILEDKPSTSRRSTKQVKKEVDDEAECQDATNSNGGKKGKEAKAPKGRPKPFACDICPKMFYKQDRFEGHMRQHKGLKPFACQDCDKQYSKLSRLNNHRLNDHTDNPMRFCCPAEGCTKMYRNRESLYTHESKHHGPPKPEEEKGQKSVFICELCGKALSSRGVLRKHTMIHKDEYPFACDQCPKKYRTHHRLALHTMRHKGIKNYECRICGLKKTTGHELNVHMNVHTKAKKFPCKFCDACFLNNGNLVRHIKVVHDGIKTYACTFCDLSFGKAETLKHHVMRHTGEKPHECPICGRRFIQKTSFQLHVKRHEKAKNVAPSSSDKLEEIPDEHEMMHKGVFPHACDQCPRKFRVPNKLALHKLRHEGIKNFQCPKCNQKKTTKHELNIHMNVHTREKQYPCKFCKSCFLTNGNLVRHIKVVHDGIKTFVCPFCDQTFGKAETLKHHVMRHTGEKPHECPICGKKFIQKTSFQYHVKRHNKLKNDE